MPGIQQLLNIYPSGGYQIANSLRFRSSASAYLSRTPASAGNQQKWTWSAWVKLGDVSTSVKVVFGAYSTDPNSLLLYFGNNQFTCGNASGTVNANTAALFRDPSAWYHIVVVWDTTQATATNRIQIYVNGVAQTQVSVTSPSLNYSGYINASGVAHSFARSMGATPYYFDGYLADINFIDGQALTPSSFGQISSITGVWQPIAYTGTYGTNGFKLNFSNGTSTTTLGYDSSGNSNNWTTNNISLTAGSTYDWMLDSPTPFAGSSYGVGNYAVLNPLTAGGLGAASITNGNLTATYSATDSAAFSTIAVTSGAWYWEVIGTTVNNGTNYTIGATTIPYAATTARLYASNGQYYNGSSWASYGASYTNGDVIGVALDMSNQTIEFYKNGVSQGQKTSIGLSGQTIFAQLYANYASNGANFNFGQRPFSYTPPTGYKSLCTYNLPAASIVNGASYMAATTYTGTGASQAISNAVNGVSFQPDMVWVKSRSAAQSNSLQDSVRGATLQLSSNLTAAEITSSGEVTAFNSNGFSLGADISGYGTNTNAATYVGWQWKANGTAVSNTAGSITSQVSANTISGFSVVTYTNPASGPYTVGHGLGVAPNMILFKSRTNGSYSWVVYHLSIGNTGAMFLNATAAVSTSSSYFNNTSPTSSIITLGASAVGVSGDGIVAYCFAAIPGYSAISGYTGNGVVDGPFVYCGFRPRFVLIKCTNAIGSWVIFDSSRLGYNATETYLVPNTSAAESTTSGFGIDILSNGFKLRANDTTINGSGYSYIFAAFAENPFQNALAR
jgi:Concanavalin A-like lectin/glucanases superfamily/SPRY domain